MCIIMTHKEQYHLPGRKKIKLNINCEYSDHSIEIHVSALFMEVKYHESRELNIRLRFDADHDSNMKILNTVDVSRFKLGKNTEGLTKEGVCLAS